MAKLTRRELGLAVLASQAITKTTQAATDAIDEKLLDPLLWTKMRADESPRKLRFQATNRKQAEEWQGKLRDKVVDLVGGFPVKQMPLAAQTIEVKERNGFRRERFFFMSKPGVGVAGYLLTPLNSKPPYATMICVAGHGRGADDIVGIDEHGNERTVKPHYQYDFAIQAVEHGMAAVAIEPMAFGCRRDAGAKAKGPSATTCQPNAGTALLLGETMVGWRVYDVMRTIDWIATRKELDSSRIGCMGISGGGTITLFATALDKRIKTGFVSGYLNTFHDSIVSVSHCIDNYVPGILNWAEMYDVAGLIAPRPLFAEAGDKDKIFPLAGSRKSFAEVQKIYDTFGKSANFDNEIFDGVHQFHGVKGLPFAAKALQVG